MKSASMILSALFAGMMSTAIHADTLLLYDAISQEPSNSTNGLMRPRNGMKKEQVRAKYGEPGQSVPAIGDPPISRWVYDQYTVYFEHDLVLNTVVHR